MFTQGQLVIEERGNRECNALSEYIFLQSQKRWRPLVYKLLLLPFLSIHTAFLKVRY